MQNIEIHSLPVLTDNYIHIVRDHVNHVTIVVDPAESAPVQEFLSAKKWVLTHILVTHHHNDHIGGVKALNKATHCKVVGAKMDAYRLPKLDLEVEEGDNITIGSLDFEVLHLPGHTLGHIAYISKKPAIAFTGDVLFGMGCGRVFEGTMEEAYASIDKIAKLAPDTLIYCTHEYTEKNAQFANQCFLANSKIEERLYQISAMRKRGQPTVPLLLKEELVTNPFLLASDVEEFSKLRKERNQY